MPAKWDYVANAVKRRRLELGISQREAASRAGVSPTTWASLETRKQRIDDLSRPKFCAALGWRSDSIDLILIGEEPIIDETYEPIPSLEVVAQRVKALEIEIAAIRQKVEQLGPDGL